MTNEMKKRILNMAAQTWDVIADDTLDLEEEQTGKREIPVGGVIEMVCDANRMLTLGGDSKAYEAWKDLPREEQTKIVREAFPYQTYV